jgi:hypothetical protein
MLKSWSKDDRPEVAQIRAIGQRGGNAIVSFLLKLTKD